MYFRYTLGHVRLILKKHFISQTTFCFLIIFVLGVMLTVQNYSCQQRYSLYNPYLLPSLAETSGHIYHSLSASHHITGLRDNSSYITAHYMWCNENTKQFGFRHYLSVLSIIKAIQPDEVIFHYASKSNYPSKDQSWFQDLQRDIIFLSIDPEPSRDLCRMFLKSEFGDTKQTGQQETGIFIEEGIILSDMSRKYILDKMKLSCNKFHCEERPRHPLSQRISIKGSSVTADSDDVNIIKCLAINDINELMERHSCVLCTKNISVEDILTSTNTFSSLARKTLYGREHPVEVITSSDNPIPLHGHIISEQFSELTLASINSALQFSGLETIFLHGKYIEPNLLKELRNKKTKFYFIEISDRYFPSTFSSTLLYSLNVLLLYGGVFFKENVVWLNPISPSSQLRNCDTVVVQSSNEIDFSILMAKPGAKFLQKLVPLVMQMSREEGEYKKAAYHLYQQHPNTVFFSRNLTEIIYCGSENCLPVATKLKNPDSLTVSIHFID